MSRPVHDWYVVSQQDVFNINIDEKPDEVVIKMGVGRSDDVSAEVTLTLYDAGHTTDDGRKLYDADLHIGNSDNVPLTAFGCIAQAVIDWFYEHDNYNKKWAIIGDDH